MTEKIENALNEARILVLGVQVLIGFQFQAVFQKGFSKLSAISQNLELMGLVVLMVCLTLLLAPASFQRIIEQGNVSNRFQQFISHMIEAALFPFAVVLGIDTYVGVKKESNEIGGVVCGLGIALIALFFWYGLEALVAAKQDGKREELMNAEKERREKTPLADRIKFVLTEAPVVLPGAQAILGFQFAVLLMEPFEQMPIWVKYVHLASLFIVGISTILLMAPASYHRIVEGGEDTERLHTFASRILLAAMTTLALGMTGDLVVVIYKGTGSFQLSLIVAILSLAFTYGLWFGYIYWRKVRSDSSRKTSAEPAMKIP